MTAIGTLAADVAAALGDGWMAKPGPWDRSALLCHADGRELMFDSYRANGGLRAEVRGHLPGDRGLAEHRITVAVSRGGQVIAGEITRRMLPAYETELAQARERLATQQRERAARDETAAEIMRVPGARSSAIKGRYSTEIYFYDPWARAEVRDGGQVKLEMELLGEVAARVLRLAREGGELDGATA